MRRYLLDTTPLAAYLVGRPQMVEFLTPLLTRHELATSILVYAEVVEYLQGFPDFPARLASFRRLLRSIYPYFLTYPMLHRYGTIRRQVRPPHGPGLIGDIDTLIAATALERNLTLITTDTDYDNIPHLKSILFDRTTLTRLR